MTDDHRPEMPDPDVADDAGRLEVTRRQLLVGGAALGLSLTAAGSLLTKEALAGGQTGVGQVQPPGQTSYPQMGYPMPGDPRPDAPELAYRGPYHVGVRRWTITNPDQLNILEYSATNTDPRYDRPLPIQVWYPAVIPGKVPELTTYADTLGSGPGNPDRPVIPFEFPGRALRGARPDRSGAPFPLLIVSHGYPGSDVLLTNLTENLASKGYVVVAISHTDSTHADATLFASTMLNRPLDINFVLKTMGELGAPGSGSFLSGLVDADRTGLIGYSMGGYGALIAAGAGITPGTVYWGAPGGKLSIFLAGSPEYAALLDPRVKAIVPLAPWGGGYGVWNAAGLAALEVPALFVVGDQDQTAPYAGVKFIFENAVNSDRYRLLYHAGDHEVPANPAPPITFTRWREYVHYQEPALDNTRTNNVNQHFLTAFLGLHLKGDADLGSYLDVVESSDASNNYNNPGYPEGIWKGFKIWSAVGMEMKHLHP
ncbi:MAG TPA: dienelactone hydrolase [Thermoleophilia bacterium]|nr:dienelactone hydrolase [Thermoleophilia bacterium]